MKHILLYPLVRKKYKMIDFVKKITLQEKKLKRKETSSIKSYDHKPFMFL